MTSPSRRKRRTTRPSIIRLRRSISRWAAEACALAWLAAPAPASAELAWRRAGAAADAQPPSAMQVLADDGVRLAAADMPLTPGERLRSVLVERDGARVAMAPRDFDPFEADELAQAAPMPEGDAQAAVAEAVAPPAFDPFEAEDAGSAPADDLADELAPTDAAAMQDAFHEPAAEDNDSSEAADLDAARKAIDEELLRRDVERGVADELVTPEEGVAEETSPPEGSAEEAPGMEDEVVEPEFDPEQMEEDLLENYGEYSPDDEEMDLQVGPGGQPFQLTPEQEAERQRQLEQERVQHEAECNELLDAVRRDHIRNISLDIRVTGSPGEDYPLECHGRATQFQPRAWGEITYLWKASGLCHKPLYFEQVQLERYGHDAGPVLAPIVSGAHFFGTLPILPYKMGLQTPQECVYTLGYYRPGNCAPYMITPLGFTWRAAAFQAGAVTGTALVVP